MPLINLKKFSKVFVETGTYYGETVRKAIESGYEEIHSIEINDFYYQKNKIDFKNNKNIFLHKGDSSIILFETIKNINDQITFWLDGHYMSQDDNQKENQTQSKKIYPILEELDLISLHKIKNHIIMIDDMHDVLNYIELSIIKEKIYNINKNYKIQFIAGQQEDEILLAQIE
jgi:hypothetical protein